MARRRGTQTTIIMILCAFIAYGLVVEVRRASHLGQLRFQDFSGEDAMPAFTTTNSNTLPYPREVWAGGWNNRPNRDNLTSEVRNLLGGESVAKLAMLCGRVMYNTLTHSITSHGLDDWAFVSTGDIPEMWIRDSAVQMAIYIPLLRRRPALRRLLEGTIRTQAYFTVQDPYANSFYSKWKSPNMLEKADRELGRGGWTGTRNYELDSGAYFIHMLWNYYASGVYGPDQLLAETVIFDAVSVLVDTWTTEQYHEDLSKYRYVELTRAGLGTPTAYTGMSWTGFRPSDDQTTYGYSIPSNIYAAAALQRALELNARIWKNDDLRQRAERLLSGIEEGIREFGVVQVEDGTDVYAYEVDGLGGISTNMDDANVPSLLSIPLLGWSGYNKTIYANTRARLLSSETNEFYFEGAGLHGIGSPHTGPSRVWPLAIIVRALTAGDNTTEIAQELKQLLITQCGSGTMHESVNVLNKDECTRPVFQWANAAAVTAIEALLGVDCDSEAEKLRHHMILKREKEENAPPVKPIYAYYFETLESHISRDQPSEALTTTYRK